MENKPLSARQIAMAVAHSGHTPFLLRKNEAVVENVSWGLFSWGEADLIAMTKAGYLIEGEIKISKTDFLKDSSKKKFTENHIEKWKRDIKRFFYIVPDHLREFALANTEHGVISVSITEKAAYKVKIEREGKYNIGRKLFIEERMQLMRLGCFRAWRSKNE
jgi:hypothetical protein